MHGSSPMTRGKLALTSMLVTLSMLDASAGELGRLPTGVVAGDMDLSPFYRWNARLPDKPGVLLREEALPRQRDMDAANTSLRILYTSTDVRWRSGLIPVSIFPRALLRLEAGRSWPGGTVRPVLPIHALRLGRCMTSVTPRTSIDGSRRGSPLSSRTIKAWEDLGRIPIFTGKQKRAPYWTLARPDLISNRVVVAGQSQGGGAALGAARLAHEYAPDVHVLGTVATGTNSTFPEGPVALPVRNSSNMFLSFVSGGLRDEGPKIDDIVSPRGRQLLETARRACTDELGALAQSLKVRGLSDVLSISFEQLASLLAWRTTQWNRFDNMPSSRRCAPRRITSSGVATMAWIMMKR
jgi:hypothetical protein